jgi:hypothetical protein
VIDGLISRTERKNYLYVEGLDDREVFWHLLNYHEITDPSIKKRFKEREEFFDIKACIGFDALIGIFEALFKGDIVYNRYGIVVDADTVIERHWKRLLKILDVNGYVNLPTAPGDGGSVFKQDGLPIVGIWLMPNNKLSGAIEEFISFLGPQDDELWTVAESVVQQVISIMCLTECRAELLYNLHHLY